MSLDANKSASSMSLSKVRKSGSSCLKLIKIKVRCTITVNDRLLPSLTYPDKTLIGLCTAFDT